MAASDMAGLRTLRRFLADANGNMSIMFAVAISLSLALGVFAIDEGALYNERRTAQATVDLAAIAAARDPANGLAMARDVLTDAGLIGASISLGELQDGVSPTQLRVDAGAYLGDESLAVDQRFVAGQAPFNAVRVWFQREGTLYLARPWSEPPDIAVAAIASARPQAAFSVGSRLVALNGGIANAVLNSLLGTNIALTAVDYNGLLNAKVNLLNYLDALAQELNITVGTYDDVLNASADHGDLARAAASLLNGAEKAAALKLANAAGNNGTVPLAKLFDLGEWGGLEIGGGADVPLADLAVLEMLTASAAVSNGTHQVALNLGAAVPGLINIALSLAVGEPAQFAPWYTVGQDGAVARTAQVRLRFVATIGGGPLLLGAQIRLPLYLEIAYAEATLGALSCPQGDDDSGAATILTRPGVARLVLGEVGDPAFGNFGQSPTLGTAKLIDLLLLKVTGSALAEIGSMTPVPLTFSADEIAAGTIKTAQSSGYVASLVTSLMNNLELNVSVLGLGLASPAVIKTTIKGLVAPLTPVLDTAIASVLEVLGLSLGEADVQVYGVRCSQAVLVG